MSARCLFCNEQIPVFRKLTGGDYCSDAHRQSYQEQLNHHALGRLMKAKPKAEEKKPKPAPVTVETPAPPKETVPAQAGTLKYSLDHRNETLRPARIEALPLTFSEEKVLLPEDPAAAVGPRLSGSNAFTGGTLHLEEAASVETLVKTPAPSPRNDRNGARSLTNGNGVHSGGETVSLPPAESLKPSGSASKPKLPVANSVPAYPAIEFVQAQMEIATAPAPIDFEEAAPDWGGLNYGELEAIAAQEQLVSPPPAEPEPPVAQAETAVTVPTLAEPVLPPVEVAEEAVAAPTTPESEGELLADVIDVTSPVSASEAAEDLPEAVEQVAAEVVEKLGPVLVPAANREVRVGSMTIDPAVAAWLGEDLDLESLLETTAAKHSSPVAANVAPPPQPADAEAVPKSAQPPAEQEPVVEQQIPEEPIPITATKPEPVEEPAPAPITRLKPVIPDPIKPLAARPVQNFQAISATGFRLQQPELEALPVRASYTLTPPAKAVEPKAAEPKPVLVNAVEAKPVDPKPAPAAIKSPDQPKPVESKPATAQPVQPIVTAPKSAEPKAIETKSQPQPASKPVVKPAPVKPVKAPAPVPPPAPSASPIPAVAKPQAKPATPAPVAQPAAKAPVISVAAVPPAKTEPAKADIDAGKPATKPAPQPGAKPQPVGKPEAVAKVTEPKPADVKSEPVAKPEVKSAPAAKTEPLIKSEPAQKAKPEPAKAEQAKPEQAKTEQAKPVEPVAAAVSTKSASLSDVGPSLGMPSSEIGSPVFRIWTAMPAAIKLGIVAVLLIVVIASAILKSRRKPEGPTGMAATSAPVTGMTGGTMDMGGNGWVTDWAGDANGSRRGKQLSLYKPSMQLKDYRTEFAGQIDKGALGWVFRVKDTKNYYGMKIKVVTAGVEPVVVLQKYAVINGVEGAKSQVSLDKLTVRNDTIYKVKLEVRGNRFTTFIQGQAIDFWTDDRIAGGGFGFANERAERATVRTVNVSF